MRNRAMEKDAQNSSRLVAILRGNGITPSPGWCATQTALDRFGASQIFLLPGYPFQRSAIVASTSWILGKGLTFALKV